MWQVLLAAAIAASTAVVAKYLLKSNASNQPQNNEKSEEQQESIVASAFDSPVARGDCNDETGCESNPEGIFRISNSGSGGEKTRSSSKKLGILRRPRLKNRAEIDNSGAGNPLEGGGRRFAVCLDKRKTSKTKSVAAKCGSSSSKDNSLFSWGLGVGIIYMMSMGKAEVAKLSTAMDETSKIVRELRTGIYKRKSKRVAANSRNIFGNAQPVLSESSTSEKDSNDAEVSGLPLIDDAECPSSVLTEEAETEVPEMDHLVAELESELQKLPFSTTEAPRCEVARPNLSKRKVVQAERSSKGFHEPEGHSVAYQCHGVLPSELDRRLCHLLIEQQENQIGELESELYLVQSKLREKEAELQALKDCVRGLTEISVSSVSDDEAEKGRSVPLKGMRTAAWDQEKSVDAMKRAFCSA